MKGGNQSEETTFGWELLLVGMGVPFGIVAGMGIALLALCMARETVKFLRSRSSEDRMDRSESTYSGSSSDDGSLSDPPSPVDLTDFSIEAGTSRICEGTVANSS